MKMKSVALTEKGIVKTAVRKSLTDYVAKHQSDIFARAKKVEGKSIYYIEVEDANGNVVYVNFVVSVATKAPFERAERKPRAKADKDNSAVEVE